MRPYDSPNSAGGTGVLGIRDAGVVDLLCDPVAMDVWDALRTARTARSIGEVCAATGRLPAEVQQAVDRLAEAGLVSMRRARGRRTAVGYLPRCRSLLVAHDPERDGELVDRVLAAIDTAASLAGRPARHAAGRFVVAAPLDRAAYEELHRRIMDVVGYMRSLGMVSTPVPGVGVDGPDGVGARDAMSICAVIDLAPLAAARNPLSSVAIVPRSAVAVADGGTRERGSSDGALTRREWDVAAAIASGGSRPEIARRLGISANTVASIAKSVYRKLGVHSRSQLAARLRGTDGGGGLAG